MQKRRGLQIRERIEDESILTRVFIRDSDRYEPHHL